MADSINALRQKWASGQATVNGWCSIGSAFTAEIMAGAGYDSLTVDVQHGFLDYGQAGAMFQAMRASDVTVLARAPWREPGIVMKLLDAGAMGLICPMISSAADAAAFVSMMRYPPLGQRSFGPTRAMLAYGADYPARANDEVLAFAMIETAEAMADLEAICATPGLDGVYIGPADLALGLGQGRFAPGLDREEPEMLAAIERVLHTAKSAGLAAAIHCGTPDYAARAVGWGFDMVTISGDSRLLAAAAKSSVDQTRALIGPDRQPGS